MTDANYSRSPAPRNSSLADLVHRNESSAHLHPQLHPSAANSDDGSQQERNHQRPSLPTSNLQLLPPPGEVSRNVHNPPRAIDTSPRKRTMSQLVPSMLARDISSLTQKPDDHASSVAQPQARISPLRVDDRRPDMLPTASQLVNVDNQSPSKSKRRSLGKESRTELLEENRVLRIELEHFKNKLRTAETRIKKMHKTAIRNESLLQKYRSKLVDVFESGRDARLSLRTPEEREHKRDDRSKLEAESVSNSQEEEWSAYSPSASFEPEQSEDIRRMHERDVMSRSEGGVRKLRRTRAPAWTAREEETFMKAYLKYGCQWKLYQDSLPGRSRRQIQSHGSYLIRQGKLTKKNSRPWQRRKPRHGGAPSSTVKDAEVEMQEEGQRSDED
ncbi:Myb-like DNA-binding protein [Gracilaria domingensis]|nr:Myb-like DNA-binding protein [Gracilaria domingensis]